MADKIVFQADDQVSATINRVSSNFKQLKGQFGRARKDIKDVQEAMRGISTLTGGALGGAAGAGGNIEEILKPAAGAFLGGAIATAFNEFNMADAVNAARRTRVSYDRAKTKITTPLINPPKLTSRRPENSYKSGRYNGPFNMFYPDVKNFRARIKKRVDTGFFSGNNPMNPRLTDLFQPAIQRFIPVNRRGERMKELASNATYLNRIKTSQRLGRRAPKTMGPNLLPMVTGAGRGIGAAARGIGALARGLGPAALAYMAADLAITFGTRMYDEAQSSVINPDYKSRYFEGSRITKRGGKTLLNGQDANRFMEDNVLYKSYGAESNPANLTYWFNKRKSRLFKEQLEAEFKANQESFNKAFFRLTRE
jgi:hypothetical protein